nr:cholesteryl ester transfer protein isoform X1 [Paramormyrops kingsleyae]
MGFSTLLLFLSLTGLSWSCLDPNSAYRITGAVCRLTYPAALALNEKTTSVIEAAFQHARYPNMAGESSFFLGKVHYNLSNLEIHDLSIGGSRVELKENDHIGLSISNVSAVFQGTILYGYGSWLIGFGHSVDFEIESNIDLVVNPRLHCGNGKVAADTSDCYLTFHKLQLLLQGDREPGWLKRLFTDFVTFTVKMVVKSQICKEINKLADILADFIQHTAGLSWISDDLSGRAKCVALSKSCSSINLAENFLSDGDIGVDISVTAPPVITSNYIESYHKGVTHYHNMTAVINASVFTPARLTEDRMLYFWFSDDLLEPLVKVAHLDGRYECSITGPELLDLFKVDLSTAKPALLEELLSTEAPELKVRSVTDPHLWTTAQGTFVRGTASVELTGGLGTPPLSFKAEVKVLVTASYADKKLILRVKCPQSAPREQCISILEQSVSPKTLQDGQLEYLREAVEKIGIPKITSYLETGITVLMNKQGLDLFDIINPVVLPQEGYVVVQVDFGFPHHLLVDFLKKTLE